MRADAVGRCQREEEERDTVDVRIGRGRRRGAAPAVRRLTPRADGAVVPADRSLASFCASRDAQFLRAPAERCTDPIADLDAALAAFADVIAEEG